MGLTDRIDGKRLYLDAAIFIYLIENPSNYSLALNDLRSFMLASPGQSFTSELTHCEVLAKPFALRDPRLIRLYESLLLESGAIAVVPTTREIYLRAAMLRGEFGLKTPDAIHMASAIESGCTAFLTNDRRIRGPKQMAILTMSD